MNIPRFARPPSASTPRRKPAAGGRAGVFYRTGSKLRPTSRGRRYFPRFLSQVAPLKGVLPRLAGRQLCRARRGSHSCVARTALKAASLIQDSLPQMKCTMFGEPPPLHVLTLTLKGVQLRSTMAARAHPPITQDARHKFHKRSHRISPTNVFF